MGRTVTGYHGGLYEDLVLMADGQFDNRERGKSRWLGQGLYFFEHNMDMALYYARGRASSGGGKTPGVLKAEIDLTACFDVTTQAWQEIVREAYQIYLDECLRDNIEVVDQKALEVLHGQVRAGYHGIWKSYGKNSLDYSMIERAIVLAREQRGLTFDTVRGAFIEWGPLYTSSWLYAGAHVAVAVRNPPERLSKMQAFEVS